MLSISQTAGQHSLCRPEDSAGLSQGGLKAPWKQVFYIHFSQDGPTINLYQYVCCGSLLHNAHRLPLTLYCYFFLFQDIRRASIVSPSPCSSIGTGGGEGGIEWRRDDEEIVEEKYTMPDINRCQSKDRLLEMLRHPTVPRREKQS